MGKYEDTSYPAGSGLPRRLESVHPLHVRLFPRQHRYLIELRRDPDLKSREQDWVEMYLLSADGMMVPRLARHFGYCNATMRRWICQFEAEGLKVVRHKRRGLGPDLESPAGRRF